MRRLFLAVCLAASVGAGANAQDHGAGADHTIFDVSKVAWAPLNVEGLPAGAEIAVLRGDLAKSGSEILLRFPAGYNVPMHNHTSDETYVWLSGAFTLVAHDGTRTRFDGPAFMSMPGNASPHALECGKQAACVVYVRYNRPFDIHYFSEPAPGH